MTTTVTKFNDSPEVIEINKRLGELNSEYNEREVKNDALLAQFNNSCGTQPSNCRWDDPTISLSPLENTKERQKLRAEQVGIKAAIARGRERLDSLRSNASKQVCAQLAPKQLEILNKVNSHIEGAISAAEEWNALGDELRSIGYQVTSPLLPAWGWFEDIGCAKTLRDEFREYARQLTAFIENQKAQAALAAV